MSFLDYRLRNSSFQSRTSATKKGSGLPALPFFTLRFFDFYQVSSGSPQRFRAMSSRSSGIPSPVAAEIGKTLMPRSSK